MSKPIVAIMYDFDKTLCTRDMQEYTFLPGINVEQKDFWGACATFAEEHQMDGILTYMYLMQKMAKGTLDITREKLTQLGEGVEFFPGVETWFDRINKIGEACGVTVEHYIISSGTYEIIQGTPIAKYFKRIYACRYMYDENGEAV